MNTRTDWRWGALGIVVLLAGWQAGAVLLGPLLMPTPAEALRRLADLFAQAAFRADLTATLLRIGAGVGMAAFGGVALGLLAALDHRVRGLLEPLRWVLMAMPPVVIVLLAMLWLGVGGPTVVFMTVLVLAPAIYVNTVKGMLTLDRGLVQMAQVFRFGPWVRLRHVYLPGLAGPLCASLLTALCSGTRIALMAEVLGAHDGLGAVLADAGSAFDSAGIYAVVLVALAAVALVEFLLLQPLQHRLTGWNRESGHD
ncbi:MAG: ABC transporter permease [Lautropia sp. SCN 70-15]|nr:MAG: ABC transporter permease [Lautropia sp. SCN 70-15]